MKWRNFFYKITERKVIPLQSNVFGQITMTSMVLNYLIHSSTMSLMSNFFFRSR